MEEQQDPPSTSSKPKPQQTVCEECRENPSKYRCPGCSIRSCSLPCVKAHKQRTGCSGKRNRTEFVRLSHFDDNILLSDYNLLEETKRIAEAAQRVRTKLRAYPQFRLPHYLKSLRSAAAGRGTKLLLLPSGMLKRQKNQSQYEKRKKFISWTIEWRFHSTGVVLLDHRVHEDTKLCTVIEKHLQLGPWNHELKQFCVENLDSLKFFICKHQKGPKSPFRELDIRASLRQQLANVVILEYPVIHVFLPSHSYDFEVVKDVHLVTHKQESKRADTNYPTSPKGVAFKVEEIEDDDSSLDPQVFDIMKNVNFSPLHQIPLHSMSGQALTETSDGPLLRVETGNRSHCISRTVEPGNFGDMEFDFDQSLIDAYSDLVAEINPDDFLDFDREFSKEAETGERKDLSDCRGMFLAEEELEEGEIAE